MKKPRKSYMKNHITIDSELHANTSRNRKLQIKET